MEIDFFPRLIVVIALGCVGSTIADCNHYTL